MAAFFIQVCVLVMSWGGGLFEPFPWGKLKDEAWERGGGDAPRTANPQTRLGTALPATYGSTTSRQGDEQTLT